MFVCGMNVPTCHTNGGIKKKQQKKMTSKWKPKSLSCLETSALTSTHTIRDASFRGSPVAKVLARETESSVLFEVPIDVPRWTVYVGFA